jgi:SAM-dependent methyltransferase
MKNKNVFNLYADYYSLIYSDKDYKGESDYIVSLLKKFGCLEGELLELGCGTGGHAQYLVLNDYTVFGVELSSSMVDSAIVVPNFKIQQGDIRALDLNKEFDAVISLFHVISYQINDEDLHAVFKTAYDHVKKDGLFIFDFWYTPAVYNLKPTVRLKKYESESLRIHRISEPIVNSLESIVDVNFTIFIENIKTNEIQKISENHRMRHFTIPELRKLALDLKFELVFVEGFMTNDLPNTNSWAATVIFKKL